MIYYHTVSVRADLIDWLARFAKADTDDKLRAIVAEDAPPAVDVSRLSSSGYLHVVAVGRVQGKLAYLLDDRRVPSGTGWPS